MELSFYRGKTVFVTGDTGFKGSWLALWLLSLGAKVVGYALPPVGSGNYTACGLSRRYKHIDGDICDSGRLNKSMKACRPDFAFHLAAQPLVLEAYRAPLYTFSVNVMGTARFLEAALGCPSLRAAVVVTTDKVYENPENGKAFLETDPLGGHDPYSASKAAAEIVTQSYARSFFHKSRCAVASARAGNVIGGGDFAANRIVPDCIRALRDGKPVLLRNPASVRPWQHVLEPLSGYLMLGAALAKQGPRFSGAWNFGPSAAQTRSVMDLAQGIVREWGNGKVVCAKKSNSQPKEAGILRLDSRKARKALGWQPRLSFQETLSRTVAEYRAMERLAPGPLFEKRIETIHSFSGIRSK